MRVCVAAKRKAPHFSAIDRPEGSAYAISIPENPWSGRARSGALLSPSTHRKEFFYVHKTKLSPASRGRHGHSVHPILLR